MERQFEISIEKLRTRIIKMCSLVDEQINNSLKAIDEGNLELAQSVINIDKKVNKQDRKVEKICQKIIALNQPVAMDLRLIISGLTISSNLERIGDLAKNIADSVLEMKQKPGFIQDTKHYEMAAIAKEMLCDAIDAYNSSNIELAKKVIQDDDKLDDLYEENRRILIDMMKKDGNSIENAVNLLEISRQLERIGDQATNIAEDVYFIVEAQVVKHKYEKYIFTDIDDEDNEDDGN